MPEPRWDFDACPIVWLEGDSPHATAHRNTAPMTNHIKAKRLEQGISQIDFARALQVDVATVWRWERGETLPHWNTLTRIANLLQTPIHQLIPDLGQIPLIPGESATHAV